MSNETKETPAGSDSSKPEPQYTALVNIRNTELTVYWQRYNIQSAVNFGLLAAALGWGGVGPS